MFKLPYSDKGTDAAGSTTYAEFRLRNMLRSPLGIASALTVTGAALGYGLGLLVNYVTNNPLPEPQMLPLYTALGGAGAGFVSGIFRTNRGVL